MSESSKTSLFPRGPILGCGAAALALLLVVGIHGLTSRPARHLADNCPGNLKQILYACQLYGGDNGDAFPPDLGALVPAYIGDAEVFSCWWVRTSARERRVAERGAITDENLSYCYVSGLTAADDPGYVLAFDEEWNHEGRGVVAARIGGRVSWQKDIAALHEELDKQTAELKANGREMKVLRPSWSTWPERPPWVPARRFWWIVGGVGAGAVLLAAVVTLFIVLRRRRRRLSAALADST